ncbi:trypsin-like peptidase domain-containing protein [Sorangium sp. So ce1153]|uniref:trypsin-like peptidase domain-containing protein n=1 Tax=Sorangium sp. So ce1153 TaxID=3133333 RepID=UPI003F604F6F
MSDEPLTKDERTALREAILSAFRKGDLKILVQDTLDVDLDVVVEDGPYGAVVASFIDWLNSQGKVRELVAGARRDNPGNPKLRAFEAAYVQARAPEAGHPAGAVLSSRLRAELASSLAAIPALSRREARDELVAAAPRAGSLNRTPSNARNDFELLIDQLPARQLSSLVERAIPLAAHDSALSQRLREIASSLSSADFRVPTPAKLPSGDTPDPELLLFGGVDARLARSFLERALQVGSSTARLKVPRWFNGVADGGYGYGTGWIVAPGLLITNDHVIDARDRTFEQRSEPDDYRRQAERTEAWFDYFQEGPEPVSATASSLVAFNVDLDVALVRFDAPAAFAGRTPLELVAVQPRLSPSHRLNIVQHPAVGQPPVGGPQRYAIRNNFFANIDATGRLVRYVTDTEPGASGSPVLDDDWKVIALHHSSIPIPPRHVSTLDMPRPVVTRYHNEGIAIHAILDWLRADNPQIHAEIVAARA